MIVEKSSLNFSSKTELAVEICELVSILFRITEQAIFFLANIYSPGDRPVPYPDIFRVKIFAVHDPLGCEAIFVARAGETIVVRGARRMGALFL